MSAVVSLWPTRAPGSRFLWVLDLDTGIPSPRCLDHGRTNNLGVCDECVSAWRSSIGADPDAWKECTVCGLPIHPAAEAFDTCPTCEVTA